MRHLTLQVLQDHEDLSAPLVPQVQLAQPEHLLQDRLEQLVRQAPRVVRLALQALRAQRVQRARRVTLVFVVPLAQQVLLVRRQSFPVQLDRLALQDLQVQLV